MGLRIAESELKVVVETDPDIQLLPFMEAANALVDKLSDNDSQGLMNSVLLSKVELYLAAGLYSIRDQAYAEGKIGDAEGVFQTGYNSQRGGVLEQNDYLKMAMAYDLTGFLARQNQASLKGSQNVGITWLGLAPSSQTDYVNRD